MSNRPLIGITGNIGEAGCQLASAYFESVRRAGGMPVVLPPHPWTEAQAAETLDRLDGIVLSGGGDLNPLLLEQEPIPALHGVCPARDSHELPLVRMAVRRRMPVLGICRGAQVIAAAAGGDVYQDIYTQHTSACIKHSQDMPRDAASHTAEVLPDTLLAQLYKGAGRRAVNSFHHQAVSRVPQGMRVEAMSPDGIIEAIADQLPPEYVTTLGVQWHPECMADEAPLFEWIVGRARQWRDARLTHRAITTLDSHEDTPMLVAKHGLDMGIIEREALVTPGRMAEGGLDCGIMVAYLPQGPLTDEGHAAAFADANRLLDSIPAMGFNVARTLEDVARFKAMGQPCVMLGVENGYAIGTCLDHIDHFARRGCVYITLCHNGDNLICDSARGAATHGGLSAFGRQVVQRMNKCGMLVDLSHAAETSFYDAIECSTRPIVCSHSSCRALCDHPRNLTDSQLQALAAQGGVAQITLYEGFLRRDGRATIDDALRHIDHAVEVAGISHVGIGTDFDGDGGVPGLDNASCMLQLTAALSRHGYTQSDIAALWGGNFMSLMAANDISSSNQ